MANQFLEPLKKFFEDSQSLNDKIRESASEGIQQFTKQPQSIIVLLELINTESLESSFKQFISIIFKNDIKLNYQEKDTTENLINEQNKNTIKANIIKVLLSCNVSTVQSQLLESIALISQNDFPIGKWDNLVPELTKQLELLLPNNNYPSINKVLVILETVFKKFREEMKTDETLMQLQKILISFPQVFLQLFKNTGQLIGNSNNESELVILFQSIKSQLEIFLSLNRIDLPEFFEDNLQAFTDEFHRYLRYSTSFIGLTQGKSEDDPSLLNQVQTVICEIVNLFTQLYDEEISNYLQSFVEDVWTLLSKTSDEIRNDHMVFAAIKFLSNVSMSIKYTLFQNETILQQISSTIVIPNLKLRECDIELFEDNKVEYMRRDIEGSDSDTRRRAAIELVKGLRKYFQSQITKLLSQDIQNLLLHYQSNPTENWLSKDSAIFTVTALAIRADDIYMPNSGGITNAEVTPENQLIPILDFFLQQIQPELSNPKTHDILKADCLKFITIFRNHIPQQYYGSIIQLLIPCLKNPDYIVHTYASTCIDRLMTLRDEKNQPKLQLSQNDLPTLLLPLVGVFQFPCSKHNERTMRAIVRIVLSMIGKVDQATTVQLLQKFTEIMLEAAANPSNHLFNHYCFEVIGSLLKTFSSEREIFNIVIPLIEYVLGNEVAEFTPYCYQILCILVESAKTEFLNHFQAILPKITLAVAWKSNNIPALVRLVQAFLKRDPEFVISAKQLEPILGIFKKLVASPAHDHEAFYILETIVESLNLQSYRSYIGTIFECIYTRISSKRTEKVIRCYVVFLNILIAKHGVDISKSAVDNLTIGLWGKTLDKIYLPTILSISGLIEKKIISIGMTKLLVDSNILADKDTWTRILRAQYSLFTGTDVTKEQQSEIVQENYLDQSEQDGYTPSFTQLQFSKKPDVDPFPTIDPKSYFKNELTNFAGSNSSVGAILQTIPEIQLSTF